MALDEFKLVKDSSLLWYNNALGALLLSMNRTDEAEPYFRKEIFLGGNLPDAYANLIQLLLKTGKYKELEKLTFDPLASEFIPTKVKRELFFKHNRFLDYFSVLGERTIKHLNLPGFLAAFLIMICWVVFLRKVDIYEPETWKYVIMALSLGMAFSFLTYPLSDINHLMFNFNINGNFLNDLLYCVLGIGAIEELVKIIPLLLLVRFTKTVNEPYDYIFICFSVGIGFCIYGKLNLLRRNQSADYPWKGPYGCCFPYV